MKLYKRHYCSVILLLLLGIPNLMGIESQSNLKMMNTNIKEYPINFEKNRDIKFLEAALEILIKESDVKIEERAISKNGRTKLWIELLSTINTCTNYLKEHEYSKIDPQLNIDPPRKEGRPSYRSGVSPEVIKDEDIREEYIKMIEKNKEVIGHHNLMDKIENYYRLFSRSFDRYLRENYTADEKGLEELQSILMESGIEPKMQNDILEKIRS